MSNPKRSVVVGEHYDQFIATQLATGQYNNASEVVRAGLRLLETEQSELEALRALIDEGDADIAAGRVIRVTSHEQFAAEIKTEGRRRLNRKS
jgi:antitoxin ParD1/3/4